MPHEWCFPPEQRTKASSLCPLLTPVSTISKLAGDVQSACSIKFREEKEKNHIQNPKRLQAQPP